ncbi:uncharacterized protein LOC110982777 [Acanthaster planci]|uniref:Uncharacterized protein LOC110982777 n=1 Tax=Acanthaster planci TaxID=133434 RepID=A0A8B7YWR8_ACAPL|nr:uncharacterized protein LOC110982777 [Acanthaster planci]
MAGALAMAGLYMAFVTWTAQGLNITRQPANVEGTQGLTHRLSMEVGVSGLNTTTQVVAIRRESEVITDRTVKRNEVFLRLGLDAAKYSVSENINEDTGARAYTLNLAQPTWVDAAEFTFLVCWRALGRCNESRVELESDPASFFVNYVPGEAYPNCTSDGLEVGSPGGDCKVLLGRPTVLSCQSEIGRPPVELTWEKDGVRVSSVSANEGAFRYERHTFTPSFGDEGAVFACNMTDLNRSCTLDINVVSAPAVTITYENTNGYIIIGGRVVFTCSATTDTSTVDGIAWTVPRELLNATDRYAISGDEFTLIRAELSDGGLSLKCSANDTDGMVGSAYVTLNVIDAADLPTYSPTVPTTAPIVRATTAKPTTSPPQDYTAIIIGSLFGGLLLAVLVGLVIAFYCGRRPRKKPVDHPSHVQKTAIREQPSPKGKQRNITANQQTSTVKEVQFADIDDCDPVSCDDPDVIPRGSRSRLHSPVRGDSLERQQSTPSLKRFGDDIPLQDRKLSPTSDKYRYDADYDHTTGGFEDGHYIYSRDPENGSRYDADTSENRSDHYRYQDDSDRPYDAEQYDYDNRGYDENYDGEYGRENRRDGTHDNRYKDYDDQGWSSDEDVHSYNDPYDQGRYSPNEIYNSEFTRGKDRRYGDRFRDYGSGDSDQDRVSDTYHHSHDDAGSYDARFPNEVSLETNHQEGYEQHSPLDVDHCDTGTYNLHVPDTGCNVKFSYV